MPGKKLDKLVPDEPIRAGVLADFAGAVEQLSARSPSAPLGGHDGATYAARFDGAMLLGDNCTHIFTMIYDRAKVTVNSDVGATIVDSAFGFPWTSVTATSWIGTTWLRPGLPNRGVR